MKQPAQIVGEVRRRRVPVLGPLRKGFQADAIQLRRDGRNELAQRLRFVLLDLTHELTPIERAERHSPAEQLVEHDAETVNVGAAVDAVRQPQRLLRRHVLIGAGNRTDSPPLTVSSRPSPKSISTGLRPPAMMTFSGFTSRWIVARVCVRERVGDLRDDPDRLPPVRTRARSHWCRFGPSR